MPEREPETEHLKEVQRKNEQLLFRNFPDVQQSETQRPKTITEVRHGKPGRKEEYRYGVANRVSARVDFSSKGEKNGTDVFDYDSSGNLQELIHRDGKDKTLYTRRYSYDADSRLAESIKISGDTRETLGEMANLYRYEDNLVIKSLRDYKEGTKDTDRFTFTNGNMACWEVLDDEGRTSETWNFAYDEQGRITSETHEIAKSGHKATWEYQRDETGNITKATHLDSTGKEISGYDVEIQYENK